MYKVKEFFKLILENIFYKNGIENVGYLSRWIVLWLDAQVVFFVLVTVAYIDNNFLFSFLNERFLYQFLLVETVTIVFFILFKTYVGVIRHSSYVDAAKLLFSSLFSALVLLVVNGLIFEVSGKMVFSPIFIIIFSLSLFCGLFMYRLLIKQIFANFMVDKKIELEPVFILGVSQNAISIAIAIENEIPKRFKVVGFLEKEEQNTKKRILGLPILHLNKKMHVITRANRAKGIIVLENDLKNDSYREHIEECVEFNVKVYRAPSISQLDFNNGVNGSIQNIQIEDLLGREPIQINNINILNLIKDKTVFITGGAGSIGSEIVHQLGKYKPKELVVIDQAETPLHDLSLKIEIEYPNLVFTSIICDIRNKESLEYLFKKYRPEIVYHCAAYKHVPMMEKNPAEAVSVNICGSKNLADLAAKYKTERFVMISTDKAVNPSNVMGASKRVAEMYVQSLHNYLQLTDKNSTKFITTRFGNVLGSSGSVVPLFKKQIDAGGPVTITHPEIIRYFMTIPEACQLVMEASCMGKGGEIFIFDMGKAIKIVELAHKMIKLAGFVPGKEIKIKTIGLRPGEKLYEELLNDKSITLPTYHEKIMIVKENNNQFERVSKDVEKIAKASKGYKTEIIVKKIKELVPEFKSLNSDYEKLDAS